MHFTEKETLLQVFSFKFCEIFKSTFFIAHLWWLLLRWFTLCRMSCFQMIQMIIFCEKCFTLSVSEKYWHLVSQIANMRFIWKQIFSVNKYLCVEVIKTIFHDEIYCIYSDEWNILNIESVWLLFSLKHMFKVREEPSRVVL